MNQGSDSPIEVDTDDFQRAIEISATEGFDAAIEYVQRLRIFQGTEAADFMTMAVLATVGSKWWGFDFTKGDPDQENAALTEFVYQRAVSGYTNFMAAMASLCRLAGRAQDADYWDRERLVRLGLLCHYCRRNRPASREVVNPHHGEVHPTCAVCEHKFNLVQRDRDSLRWLRSNSVYAFVGAVVGFLAFDWRVGAALAAVSMGLLIAHKAVMASRREAVHVATDYDLR